MKGKTVDTENTTTTSTETKPAETPAERRYVAITLTDALRDAIEAAAKAGDTTPGLLCRDIVAKHFGVTITVDRAPAKKYESDDERKAAQKSARQNMNVLRARLVAEHKARQSGADEATVKQAGDAAEAASIKRMEAAAAKPKPTETEKDTATVVNAPAGAVTDGSTAS